MNFKHCGIRLKLTASSVSLVLIVLCLIAIGFSYGFLELKNHALPTQRSAMSVESHAHEYLSELLAYIIEPDEQVLKRIRVTESELAEELRLYQINVGRTKTAKTIGHAIEEWHRISDRIIKLRDDLVVAIDALNQNEAQILAVVEVALEIAQEEVEAMTESGKVEIDDYKAVVQTRELALTIKASSNHYILKLREYVSDPNAIVLDDIRKSGKILNQELHSYLVDVEGGDEEGETDSEGARKEIDVAFLGDRIIELRDG